MKILITGAAGQLGQEWIEFCKSNKIESIGYSSSELDITNFDQLKAIVDDVRPTIIANCAAFTKVDEAEDQAEKAELINAKAVKYLADISAEYGIKLIHYSTDYVFKGEEKDKLSFPTGYPEDHEINPINEYGRTKWLGEKALIESHCSFLLIRVSWLCGKYGNNFVKTMQKLGVQKEELSVVNDQFGSPTFTDEVVSITHKLIKKGEEGIFHVSSSGIINWFTFARQIFLLSDINVQLNEVPSSEFPTKALRPKFSKLDTSKLNKTLGIESEDWRVGLKRLIDKL